MWSLFWGAFFTLLKKYIKNKIKKGRGDRKGNERGGVRRGPRARIELGTPIAQQCFISAQCPQGYWRRSMWAEWSGSVAVIFLQSGEHLSEESATLAQYAQRHALNPKCPLVICYFENLWNSLSNILSKLMFLKANSKILWRLTDVLLDRISSQFWSILILESVLLLFMPWNNSLLSAFHIVCTFMGLISKVYFVKFYICISSCVRVLNILFHNNWSGVLIEKYTFSVINFFAKWLQKQDMFLN